MKEDYGLGELLQSAERLTAEIESSNELPRVHRNLRQIVEAGQLLLHKSSRADPIPDASTKAAIFLGSKGVDITKLSYTLDPLSISQGACETTTEGPVDIDIEGFLKMERMDALCSAVEGANKNMEEEIEESISLALEEDWLLQKEEIMVSLTGALNAPDFETSLTERKRYDGSPYLTNDELTYSHEIDLYNKALIYNQPKPNLLEKFESISKSSTDKSVQDMWTSVSAMLSNIPPDSHVDPIAKRTSQDIIKLLITRAKKYLERTFLAKMQTEVFNNLGRMNLGGSPDIINFIKGYLSVKNIRNNPGLEFGPGDSGPLWAVVYFCLRCGKPDDAIRYLRDSIGNVDFCGLIEEYAKLDGGCGSGLPKDMEAKLRLEYRRVHKNNCTDIYKKAVYCYMAGCDVNDDHSEVANRLDDYLWFKLGQIRTETSDNRSVPDFIAYHDFQILILEKYGETHFDAFKLPFNYFQALWLTGQFEAAIEFLARVGGLRIHAIHVAIVLMEANWLITGAPRDALLRKIDGDPPGIRRLNFTSLIVQFARNLQTTNSKEALNYLFFLREMKEKDGKSLFHLCVSDLVMESREFSLLLGTMAPDGCRKPGLLESMGISIAPIVEHCAQEAENQGLLEDAAMLFDLASKHEMALKVLIRIISLELNENTKPSSDRHRIQHLAIELADRYQQNPPTVSDKNVPTTFFILLDFLTFYDEYYSERHDQALKILERMKIIPFESDDVSRAVTQFHLYSDEIRMNVASLVLAAMDIIMTQFKKLKNERKTSYFANTGSAEAQGLDELKKKSNALLTYCGIIPYFITSDVYAKVAQFDLQMN